MKSNKFNKGDKVLVRHESKVFEVESYDYTLNRYKLRIIMMPDGSVPNHSYQYVYSPSYIKPITNRAIKERIERSRNRINEAENKIKALETFLV